MQLMYLQHEALQGSVPTKNGMINANETMLCENNGTKRREAIGKENRLKIERRYNN